VVYYDQRGCGQSDYAKLGGYTIEQAVDDLDRLREALGLNRWVVLGWSYGGVLAQCYTARYPDEVAGLVLVASGTDAMHLDLQPSRQFDLLAPEERKRIADIQRTPGLTLEQRVFNAHLNGDWKRQSFYRPSTDELARVALYGWKHDPVFRASIGRCLTRTDLRGAFERCPIAILLIEGRHDLTWGADKAQKLQACFPESRLVVFERSAHAPFADEPNKFFSTLREFMKGLTENQSSLDIWKSQLAGRQAAREKSAEYVLQTSGWGKKSAKRIAAGYSRPWLAQVTDPTLLLKLALALYDARRYSDALTVFLAMEKAGGGGVAVVWQGHMFDLLGRRPEALVAYRKASGMSLGARHDQYGIVVSREYVETRLRTPFTWVENSSED
jgi:proline iminopeptidase